MLIQVRVVVRTTRTSDRPSTPTLYWIPNAGIQSTLLAELEAPAGAGSKPISSSSDRPNATSAVTSAVPRIGPMCVARQERDDDRADERHERDQR